MNPKKLPVSLSLAIAAIVIACFPAVQTALQFDREAVAGGEIWRIVTCQWVHWSFDHAFWDILVFAVLAPIVERRNLREFWLLTLSTLFLIPAAIVCWEPNIATYRGLSGLDTGLFTLLILGLLAESFEQGNWRRTIWISGGAIGLLGKTVFEYVTGDTLFVQPHATGFTPLVSAHLVGAAAACLAKLVAIACGSTHKPARQPIPTTQTNL